MNFPQKYNKVLAASTFKDDADAMSEEQLKQEIFKCEGNIHTIEKSKEEDETLKAKKEELKDLNAAYREAELYQKAKIKYCLYLLEGKGIDLDSQSEDNSSK